MSSVLVPRQIQAWRCCIMCVNKGKKGLYCTNQKEITDFEAQIPELRFAVLKIREIEVFKISCALD